MDLPNEIPLYVLNECEVLIKNSIVMIARYDFSSALVSLQKCLKLIFPFRNHPEGICILASIYQYTGSVLRDTGKICESYKYIFKSCKLWLKVGRKDKYAENLFYLGALFEMLENYPAAHNYYKRALEYFDSSSSVDKFKYISEIENKIHIRLGTVYTKTGQIDLARKHLDFCNRHYRGEVTNKGYLNEKTGLLEMAEGHWDNASDLLERSLRYTENNNIIQIARTHIALAHLSVSTNEKNKSVHHLTEAHKKITIYHLGHLKKGIKKILTKYFDQTSRRYFDMSIPQVNVVILTALPVEYKSVLNFIKFPKEVDHPRGTVYENGYFDGNKLTFSITLAEIGPGNSSAAFEAERAIEFVNPSYIIFVGVAGGIKDVELGDVVIANKIYGYEFGQEKNEFLPRPNVGESDYGLEQRARAESKKIDWLQRLNTSLMGNRQPKVFIGPIAAGEKVIKSRRSYIASFLKKQYSDALAIEMEGRGFLTAVRANNAKGIVIRGISDLLSKKNISDKAGCQEIAASNAAAFTFQLLSNL